MAVDAARGDTVGVTQAHSPNYLVISDLHLGEDIGPDPVPSDGDSPLRSAEARLIAFLGHYTANRSDDRPWTLIVNGDMVDFLSVCVTPLEVDDLRGWSEDDHWFGLGTRQRGAVLKIRCVFERHHAVFEAMAQFLKAGNTVAVVIGNHDAEFHWPEVQHALREQLRRLSDDDAARRLEFHPWCFFEEGVLWAEHGHQYDGYCSFDALLDPVDPTDEQELDLNVGSAVMRFVGNHHPLDRAQYWDGIDPVTVATWFSRIGPRRSAEVLLSYGSMVGRLLERFFARWMSPDRVANRRRRHEERLERLAARLQVAAPALRQLDAMRRRPVVRSFASLLQGLMLDRVLIGAGALLAIAIGSAYLPWMAMPIGLLSVVCLVIVADQQLASRREPIDPDGAMRRASRVIRRTLRAPVVVFGHSHEPVAERLDDGWYYNTGTWVPLDRPGLSRAFTHVRILRRQGKAPSAALLQWRNGQSLAFDPTAPC